MDIDQKIDGRDVRDGGWYWVQEELLYVFAPLIGYKAAWLYTVMCKLIPLTVENPLMDLSLRMIVKSSQLSLGSVHREMATLIAVGLIEETKHGKGKPSAYKLVSLRKLAGLGNAELAKRLSVPAGNTGEDAMEDEPALDPSAEDAQSPAAGGLTPRGAVDLPARTPAPPAPAGDASVPPGNTSGFENELGTDAPKNIDFGPEVFQKGGGSVPETGGLRSKTGGDVFQQNGPFNSSLEKTIQEQDKTPPTPSGEGVEPSPRSLISQPIPRPGESRINRVDLSNFGDLKLQLKAALVLDKPLHLDKKFTTIKPGESDWDACFKNWWLIAVKGFDGGVAFETFAEDVPATEAALKKYATRLEKTARAAFAIHPLHTIRFSIRNQESSR